MNGFRWFMVILAISAISYLCYIKGGGENTLAVCIIYGVFSGSISGFIFALMLEGFWLNLKRLWEWLEEISEPLGNFFKWLIPRAILGTVVSVASSFILSKMGIDGSGNLGISLAIFSITVGASSAISG